MRVLKAAALAAAAFLLQAVPPARAAEGHIEIPNTRFSFDGIFGTFDRASVQRGYQVYSSVCANCHAMHLLSYRNLREIGLTDAQVRAAAASVQVTAGPNDEGQMFQRPGLPSDRFHSPFANEAAARAANNGAYPPDLSLIVKARANGADYIHALLMGYQDAPAGVTVPDGMNYNAYYPGHMIGMAKPLGDGSVEYTDGTATNQEQLVRDVSSFLAWAAEPELESRRAMGVRMVIFLSILGGLVYTLKRRIWRDVH